MNQLPPIDILREHFTYDPETGELRWLKPTSKSVRKGSLAGSKKTGGYLYVKLNGVLLANHRIAWALYYGEDPYPHIVDHKQGVDEGNAISNLRLATRRDNTLNSKLFKHNTSGYRGVQYDKDTGKWRASIKISKKRKRLGSYDTKEEAFAARVQYEQENNIFVRFG